MGKFVIIFCAETRSSSSVESFCADDEMAKIEKRLGVKFGSLASSLMLEVQNV